MPTGHGHSVKHASANIGVAEWAGVAGCGWLGCDWMGCGWMDGMWMCLDDLHNLHDCTIRPIHHHPPHHPPPHQTPPIHHPTNTKHPPRTTPCQLWAEREPGSSQLGISPQQSESVQSTSHHHPSQSPNQPSSVQQTTPHSHHQHQPPATSHPPDHPHDL